ncbi:MAG TPA: CPBP family intramembrane metalloprotease [bacterium]|nr:CPBP family intramembrane metalloprotease [bacterium]
MSYLKEDLIKLTNLGQVAVLLFIYLVVMGVATSVLPARPGDWEFALAMMLPLPIVAFGLRKTVFTVRGNISPITELTVIAASLAMCLIAMIGTRPGMNGSVTFLPAAIIASAAIAIGEEILFRGALLPALSERFGFIWGILLSAIVFGSLHLEASYFSGLTALIAGVALGSLYVRSGLGACVVFHLFFNIVCGPMMGLPVGGLPWPGLLSPANARDPLTSGLVLAGFALLAVWWFPWEYLVKKKTPADEPQAV